MPLRERVDEDGFAIVESVLEPGVVEELIAALESDEIRRANESAAANLRNLGATVPQVARFYAMPVIRQMAMTLLGGEAFVVRSLLFDKTPGANWKVRWHQDLTIAVREKRETGGFSAWSVKAGIPHVQPPVSLLERMITLRVHLDRCDASNGALKVIPGSHRHGRLTAEEIERMRGQVPATTCAVDAGGVLVMRPLLLHSSAPAE